MYHLLRAFSQVSTVINFTVEHPAREKGEPPLPSDKEANRHSAAYTYSQPYSVVYHVILITIVGLRPLPVADGQGRGAECCIGC